MPSLPYSLELSQNLHLSRTILHHTSRRRLFPSRSYGVALRATLSLSRSIPYFLRHSSHPRHVASITLLDASLRMARQRAGQKASSLSVAQDVFALLSHFLGLPEPKDTDAGLILFQEGKGKTSGLFGWRRGHDRLAAVASYGIADKLDRIEKSDAQITVEQDNMVVTKWRRAKSEGCLPEFDSVASQ